MKHKKLREILMDKCGISSLYDKKYFRFVLHTGEERYGGYILDKVGRLVAVQNEILPLEQLAELRSDYNLKLEYSGVLIFETDNGDFKKIDVKKRFSQSSFRYELEDFNKNRSKVPFNSDNFTILNVELFSKFIKSEALLGLAQ